MRTLLYLFIFMGCVQMVSAQSLTITVQEAKNALLTNNNIGTAGIAKGTRIQAGDRITIQDGGYMVFEAVSPKLKKTYKLKETGTYEYGELLGVAEAIPSAPAKGIAPQSAAPNPTMKRLKQHAENPDHTMGNRTDVGRGGTPRAATAAGNGTAYAVVIGVAGYKNLDEKLKYTRNDANAFSEYLAQSEFHVPQEHIFRLSGSVITHDDIIAALSVIRDSAKKNDKVFFYFAGHGDLEATETAKSDDYVLLLTNCLTRNYRRNSNSYISLQVLYREFDYLTSKGINLVTVFDACRSGNLAGGEIGRQSLELALKQHQQNSSFLSCGRGEVSVEGPQWGNGRGAFSFFLTEGLKGTADLNKNGTITPFELKNYMLRESEKWHLNQHMVFDGDEYAAFVSVKEKQPSASFAEVLPEAVPNPITSSTVPNAPEVYPGSITASIEQINGYIEKGQLIHPAGRNAFDVYKTLSSSEVNPSMLRDTRLRLANALQHRFNNLIDSNFSFQNLGKVDVQNPVLKLPRRMDEEELKFILQELQAASTLYDDETLAGKIIQAKILFTEALLLTNDDVDNPYNATNFSAYKNAVEKLESAAMLDSQSPLYSYQAGFLAMKMGDYKLAKELFTAASAMLPNDEYLYNYLGFVNIKLKDFKSAESSLLQSFTINSKLPANSYNLFMLYSSPEWNNQSKAVYYKGTYERVANTRNNSTFDRDTY